MRARSHALALAILVGLATRSRPADADEEPPCVTGLVLDTSEADAAAVTAAVCRAARARGLSEPMRVGIVIVGGRVSVSATRTDASTGAETVVAATWPTFAAAIREAPKLFEPPPASSAARSTPPGPPAPPAPPIPAEDTTQVTLRSPGGIQLQQVDATGRWATACMAPCNVALPRRSAYRVVDGEGHPHQEFRLDTAQEATTVEVRPRNRAADVLGIVSVVGGGILLGAGVFTADQPQSSAGTYAAVGLLAALAGTVTLLANTSDFSVKPSSGGSSL